MKQNTVKFSIDKKGEIRMEVIGGIGSSCTEVTKDLEVSLSNAGTKTDEGKKPEYYENEGSLSIFNNLS